MRQLIIRHQLPAKTQIHICIQPAPSRTPPPNPPHSATIITFNILYTIREILLETNHYDKCTTICIFIYFYSYIFFFEKPNGNKNKLKAMEVSCIRGGFTTLVNIYCGSNQVAHLHGRAV